MFRTLNKKLSARLEHLTGSEVGATLSLKVGGSFFVNAAGTAIAFVLQIILARVLGADNFGQYTYALTWIVLLVLLGKLGLDTAALRLLPEYQATERWTLLRGFVRWSTSTAAITSIIVAVFTAGIVVLAADKMEKGLTQVFLLACPLLPLIVHLSLQSANLQAFRHIVQAQAPQVIVRPFLLAAVLLGIGAVTSTKITAATAMVVNIVTTLATISVVSYLARTTLPRDFFHGSREYTPPEWAKIVLPMLMITGFNMLINQTDIIMVGALMTTKEAGIYAAASRVTLLLPFAIVMVNSVAAPVISQLYSQNKLAQLQRMMTFIAWGTLVVSAPLFAGIILGADLLLGLFGPEFVIGSSSLVILAIARLITALTGSVGYLLSMSGHQNQAAYILGASTLVNIVLNGILIPHYGMTGAAVASLISTILWTGAMVVYARKIIGINPLVSFRKR